MANVFVAGSIILLLQCLSMIQKTGKNHRNDGIGSLLLLEQIPSLFQFPLLEKIYFPNTVLLFHSKNIGIGNW